VYAFDSTTSTPAYKKVDEIFWMVHKKLSNSMDTSLGYIYVMSTPNTYTLDMKPVDPSDKVSGYKKSSVWCRTACTKSMASGLHLANKLINDQGHSKGIILFFSDGLINKGDFFDGVEDFVSEFPVHTFTVGGDAYNKVCIASDINLGMCSVCFSYLNICFFFVYILGYAHHRREFPTRDVQPSPSS
jgi:hypothetical protein